MALNKNKVPVTLEKIKIQVDSVDKRGQKREENQITDY